MILSDALQRNSTLRTLYLGSEYGGRGGEGRREERGREGELGVNRTRTHGLSRGGVKPWALGFRLLVCVGF